jgi:hypothetical protein
MPAITLELAERENALALQVSEWRASHTSPQTSVDQRITAALTQADPVPFAELRGMCCSSADHKGMSGHNSLGCLLLA